MRFDRVDRRIFIALASGGVMAWQLRLRAQATGHIPRIAVLMNVAADHPESQPRLTAFLEAMRKLGWRDGDNARIDVRWGADDADLNRKYAQEFVALQPDIIFATGTSGVKAVQSATRTLPTVFALVTDPVGSGFVDSLSHPGGNATGFMAYDYSIAGKWLEILKQIAPDVTRVGVVRDPGTPQGIGLFGAIQIAAPSLGVEASVVNARNDDEIRQNIAGFARSPHGGLVVIPASGHGALIVELAARYALPSIHGVRSDVTAGGLASYGPDRIELFRRAAEYVDRILKGAKPADLPVQAPTKYELVINLKTAKALGLPVPPALIAGADEVIE